jgi:PAS domain S-box-containing protein
MVEEAPIGILIGAVDGRFLSFNAAFASLFGYAWDEMWQQSHDTIVHPSDLHRVQELHTARIRGDKVPERYDFQAVRKDGSTFHAEVAATALKADGQTLGTCSYMWDVSERKILAAELAESRTSFQAITKHNTEGILVIDSQGTVRFANPAARSLFGGRELVGEAFGVSQVRGSSTEIEVISSDGRHGIAEMRTTDTEWFGESATLVILRDVTAMREAEQQLREQQRLASVGQLAAGIAHDFNNLLQAITLQTELASRLVEEDSKVAGKLGSILSQAGRATTLIRQILDFARQSASQREPLLLNPLLKEIVKLLRRTIPESVAIELDLPDEDLWVTADAGQLRELLTNLAVNASDAMSMGGQLRIEVAEVEVGADDIRIEGMMPGTWVCLKVSDTGIGMSKETMERVFEPFFTTKDRATATGLGLSQAYGIVRQHDGFIGVSSTPGEGATFTVFLPSAQRSEPVEVQAEAGRAIDPNGVTVLVVEDDPLLLEMCRDGLETLGFNVVSAADGQTALRIIDSDEHRVALVLSDVVMPEMGGRELAQRVLRRDRGIAVVLMSGYPPTDDAEVLRLEGVTSWLQKPFTLDQLAAVIGSSLASSATSSE